MSFSSGKPMIDHSGRHIHYIRLSVTDRCDLRCRYCMPRDAKFLPNNAHLSTDELTRLGEAFIARGVSKIRVTGGEPLIRKDIRGVIAALSKNLGKGLDELTLTTNATQLEHHAEFLVGHGVKRINISLDTLDRQNFARLTGRDALPQVLRGIDAAQKAGLAIKINTVALADSNADELAHLISWAHQRAMALTLIEVMPLGDTGTARADQFLSLATVREKLEQDWTLTPITKRTGGPARYWRVDQTGGELGMITPLSANFCDGCNRMRVTCDGRLFACLGHEAAHDAKAALRSDDPHALDHLLNSALATKPLRHDFAIPPRKAPSHLQRTMAVTGG